MNQSDFPEFVSLLDSIAALLGRPTPGTQQSAMFFRAVAKYPMEAIRAALDAHLRDPQRGRFFPVPADVIAKIDEATGSDRPTSDEAWAISIKAADESESVVWTKEMEQAWAVCKPVMDMGDEVGARMAFKAAYDRLMAESKRQGKPAHWFLSEGFDKDRRRIAIEQAAMMGRIDASAYPALQAPSNDVLMLSGPAQPAGGIPDEVRQKFRELRERFTRKDEGPSRADLERQRLQDLKRAAAQKLAQYQTQQDAA